MNAELAITNNFKTLNEPWDERKNLEKTSLPESFANCYEIATVTNELKQTERILYVSILCFCASYLKFVLLKPCGRFMKFSKQICSLIQLNWKVYRIFKEVITTANQTNHCTHGADRLEGRVKWLEIR